MNEISKIVSISPILSLLISLSVCSLIVTFFLGIKSIKKLINDWQIKRLIERSVFPIHLYFEFNKLKSWYKNRGFEFNNSYDYIASNELSFSCTKFFFPETHNYYFSKDQKLDSIFSNLNDRDKDELIKAMGEKRIIEVTIYLRNYFFQSTKSADYELFFKISISDPQASMLEKLNRDYGLSEWKKLNLIEHSLSHHGYILDNFRYESGNFFSNTHSITNDENKYIWNRNYNNSEYHKFGKISLLQLEENLNRKIDLFITNFYHYQRDNFDTLPLISENGASGIKKLVNSLFKK